MSHFYLSPYRSKKLRIALREWYQKNKRSMPWRDTQDPYKIWLSEIILQQTRVAQGTPYYLRFVETFPDVKSLAIAPQDQVLKLWEGLGYYSRARNMHKAAQFVADELNGVFPKDYTGLLNLPGVGPYTAAAISSICYDEKRAVVDGNVVRVLSRFMSIPFRYDKPGERATYDALAQTLVPPTQVGDHNQALMELGAIICTPRQALCKDCPWSYGCSSFKDDTTELYPPPKPKIKRKIRHFHYLLIEDVSHYLIRQRRASDIWQGLYELPYIEQEEAPRSSEWDDLMNTLALEKIEHKPELILYPAKQALSHQIIVGHFYRLRIKGSLADGQRKTRKGVHLIKKSALSTYAYPRILNHFFEARLQ